ncbi:gas vesicle protein GvpG [Anaerosacchariphilus polymeriproducens]|uniref:Gas vesicle protein GvpG n=1 Tax=Anaerosacchariphilus polymeriproducens TaxID=1812858 RepID=A0A371AZE0_9FIRM|nr:gas vesicle protein GvpG [Anaerosacchariphilus polymeriproducens]RDU24978.1 gas vesicle protein GvpG [Anaerosacchariphilus polymeriproducens]
MFFLKTFINFVSLIHEYIDKEINDESKVQKELYEIRLKYEMGEISKEDYEEIKDHLMLRLQEIKKRKQKNEEE